MVFTGKDTKASDILFPKLRALRVLHGEKESSILPAGGDEGVEDSPVALASWRQHFGMPLHADDKTMARAFDPFDHAVIRNGVDDQAFAELFDRLVMRRVDLKARSTHDGAQLRAIRNLHSVSANSFLFTLLMFAGVGYLRGDVLVKRAAEHDVERLLAAADAEHRQIFFYRRGGNVEFEFGSLCFDDAKLMDRFLAVVARMDVEAAATDDQTVEQI